MCAKMDKVAVSVGFLLMLIGAYVSVVYCRDLTRNVQNANGVQAAAVEMPQALSMNVSDNSLDELKPLFVLGKSSFVRAL